MIGGIEMELSKTIKILNKGASERVRKYPGDAADWSFRAWVLKLLAKIAKQRLAEEEEPQVPQEAGLQLFKCKACDGEGYIEKWDTKGKKEVKLVSDCDVCRGEGFLKMLVVDKRTKTKDKPLYYNNEY